MSLWRKFCILLGIILGTLTCTRAASTTYVLTPRSGNHLYVKVGKGGHHLLELDDAAGFLLPVVKKAFDGTEADLDGNKLGLIPGLKYRIRIDGQVPGEALTLPDEASINEDLSCDTLRTTWRQSGRFYTGVAYSQLNWDDQKHDWLPVVPAVPIGESIYNVEFFLRPALSAARACNDTETLDEIALYYLAMLRKTETVESLLKRSNVTAESTARMRLSDPRARTFAAPFGQGLVGEGELYNSQWLHPATLLLRLISQLPEQERTASMRTFAAQMTPFVVQDQLLRMFFDQQMPSLGGKANRGRVEHWQLAMQGLQGQDHWDAAMSDIDLWLLTSAAEILGANANDPHLVPLEEEQRDRLHMAVGVGISFFQSKRFLHTDTKNFQGRTVSSVSYFNGDYDGLEEMKGTAVTGEEFPVAGKALARRGASWDTAHMYRVAVFLRALYENKKATRSSFPAFEDLQLVVNQYLYRVFNGKYDRPLFSNNFDGSDGWFRVGYNGTDFGQPPSSYCDMHNVKRLCMAPGNIIGWGELGFVNPDLIRLQSSLIRIALDENSANRAFCDRYYFWLAPFALIMSEGQKVYGGAFYAIAAENVDKSAAATH